MGKWDPPKMGTPGPHFTGRMGTPGPHFTVKMGTPLGKCKSNQVQSYVLLLHTLWADPGVWFSHKLHALQVEPLLALFTLNHLSVIPFRESTYTVNMNEHNVMLPPTFLNRHLCGGKRCKLFIFKASFKVSSHFICILVLTERCFSF